MAHLFVNSRFALAGIELSLAKAWMFSVKVRQDKTRQLYYIFAENITNRPGATGSKIVEVGQEQ